MRKEKENAKQYNKIPHYIKIEKRSGGKYHTCTEKQRTQEKTCIKLHVFKPIYKYKKNHVRAGGSYSDGYSEYRLRGIPSIVVFCLFYKMTYDILFHTLSASKMSSTSYNSTKKGREKKRKKKIITVPQRKTCSPPPALPKLYSISTFAEYLQGLSTFIHC